MIEGQENRSDTANSCDDERRRGHYALRFGENSNRSRNYDYGDNNPQ